MMAQIEKLAAEELEKTARLRSNVVVSYNR